MPWARIKEGLTHRSSTVKGGEVVEVSRDEVVSFGDKFELLEGPPSKGDEVPLQQVQATQAAIDYAREHHISLSLSNIQGTGKDGRITLSDVRATVQDPGPGDEGDGNS